MTAKNVTMTDQRSHWVRLDHNGDLEKEEIFVTFTADWRGEPCVVRMEANRYRHSSGVSEWRIFATAGKYGNDLHAYGQKELSDTARARLAAVARPTMQAWIDSDDYKQSHNLALYAWFKREVGDLKSHSDCSRLHKLVNANAQALGFAHTTRLKDAIAAFNTFQSLYGAL